MCCGSTVRQVHSSPRTVSLALSLSLIATQITLFVRQHINNYEEYDNEIYERKMWCLASR